MSLKDINISRSYKTYDQNNDTIPQSLLNPCLKQSILYQRSVGYFSSSVFSTIDEGIKQLIENKGKIQLITTPMLSKEDIETINLGHKLKNDVIKENFDKIFLEEIEKLDDDNLYLLAQLIINNNLEIKIITTKGAGEYHDKLGIFHDIEDNRVVFFGSSNASNNGYKNNYEKVRTARSWNDYELEIVQDEQEEFNNLWNGTNAFVDVFDYTDAANKGIIKICERKSINIKKKKEFELRQYQKDAIQAWKNNKYRGFFVMATGTGKTFTAIYGLKELLSTNKRIVVICAPYKHLIKQWQDDVIKVFPKAKVILVSSENQAWEKQITDEIIRLKFIKDHQLIIISTIASFQMPKFDKLIKKSNLEKVLVIDEAHRFTSRDDNLKNTYINMLGLSATPTNGKNIEESKKLVDFFGGVVFNLPIEDALKNGYLVPYNYYPIFVDATEEDEELFNEYSKYMASCFKNGVCIDKEKLLKYSKKRLRLISNSPNKIYNIESFILNDVKEKDHFVVYCGDGKLFSDVDDGERYLNRVKNILNKNNYKCSQFTASENMQQRMDLVDLFNEGLIDAMVAIRCLDEGINIPSIKSALILSSNDDLKEFVQRRGRILRTYENKKEANIYDVVVLPSSTSPGFAKIELRRVHEYARLSKNYNVYIDQIEELVNKYKLNYEELTLNDDLFMEDEYDE